MKILDLLDRSKKWTKGVNARSQNGYECNYDSKNAVCFCLHGAAWKCYPKKAMEVIEVLEAVCAELFPRRRPRNTNAYKSDLAAFNDSRATTFRDVRKVLKKANV